MSAHNVPEPEFSLFLEPAGRPLVEPPLPLAHHPQPKPAEHLCTCGKIREACVHEEIRALWTSPADPPAKPQPPS